MTVFNTGSSIIAFVAAGAGIAASLPPANGVGELTLEFRTDGRLIAPTAVYYEAVIGNGFLYPYGSAPNTYDPSYHEIDYEVTITRPAGAPSTPSNAAQLNIPDHRKNRNICRNRHGAFVMDVPGQYTITATARDWNGTVGTTTQVFNVLDPATARPASSRICLTPLAPNDPEAPAGAQQFNNWYQAMNAFVQLPGDGEILVKRGTTWIMDGSEFADSFAGRVPSYGQWTRNVSNVRVRAFGTGAKPILRHNPSLGLRMIDLSSGWNFTEVFWEDLRLEGPWDPKTQTGFNGAGLPIGPLGSAVHGCAHRCEITGFSFNFGLGRQGEAFYQNNRGAQFQTSIVSECIADGYQDYAVTGGGTTAESGYRVENNIAIMFTSLGQDPLALCGLPGERQAMGNAHGSLRILAANRSYIANNYFFTMGGWSAGGSPSGTADQPTIRCPADALYEVFNPDNSRSYFPAGNQYHAQEGNVYEGGATIVSHGGTHSTGGGIHTPHNFILQDGIMVATPGTESGFISCQGASTLRNIIGVVPNRSDFGSGNVLSNFITFGPQGGAAVNDYDNRSQINRAQPIRVINCTFVNLRNAAQSRNTNLSQVVQQLSLDRWFSEVVENNIIHAPNQLTPVTTFAPLVGSTVAGFTPRYIAHRADFPVVEFGTSSAALGPVPNGTTVTFPYPPSMSQAIFQQYNFLPTDSSVRLGDVEYFAFNNQITVVYGPINISVTNTSGVTWAAATWTFLPGIPAVPPGGSLPFPYPPGTSQAHFAANPLGGASTLGYSSAPYYFESINQFTISFTANHIIVTNPANSGVTWPTGNRSGSSAPKLQGEAVRIKLDRRSELPAVDTSRANPPDLPVIWTPATGSSAIGTGTPNLVRRDIFNVTRTGAVWRGAVQPA